MEISNAELSIAIHQPSSNSALGNGCFHNSIIPQSHYYAVPHLYRSQERGSFSNGNSATLPYYWVNLLDKSGPMCDVFRHLFSTKYCDIETGLYYYGYRFYCPWLMRWINRDPIEVRGGYNLYVSCGNNMIKRYDVLGLRWIITRNPRRRWAIARRTSETDTVEELADIIKLDATESSKWLRGGGRTKCRYRIPNVFASTLQNPDGGTDLPPL